MPNLASARAQRFHAYVERLTTALGHQDRHSPVRAYVTGLCLPGDRKSIEPMAARVDPRHVRARHQSMHHFVANAPWDDGALLRIARDTVLSVLERHGPVAAWIVDDTGFPKKGQHSVGVARQYCGMLGKQDNCQVAVSVSLACEQGSLPVAWRLYLPREWAEDAPRRHSVGVPPEVRFATKPQIALQQLEALLGDGAPRHCVLADAGYGVDTAFRQRLSELGLPYVVGITSAVVVWPPGVEPLPAKPYSGKGRPPVMPRRTARRQPLNVKALAKAMPSTMFQTISWREGTNETLSSRFAA